MSKLCIRAPGIPVRIQKYPLYELNFAKTGMQMITPPFCSANGGFDTEEGRIAERLVYDGFLPDCFLSDDDYSTYRSRKTLKAKGTEITGEKDKLSVSPNDEKPCSKFPISKLEFISVLQSLPSRFHFYQWRVVYDTAVDGFSLHHFYRRMNPVFVAGQGGLGFFEIQKINANSENNSLHCPFSSPLDKGAPDSSLRDYRSSNHRTEEIIGCFTPIVPCEKLISVPNPGDSETFVFRLETSKRYPGPTLFSKLYEKSTPGSASKAKLQSSRCIRPFCWSKDSLHSRFMRCLHEGLSIGGGKDGPALWISKDLKKGTSSQFCETFCCPFLCGYSSESLAHAEFKIIRMIWLSMDKTHIFH